MRIIGAGLGRTGTMSLKLALEQVLDAPCYHMMEVFTHPEHVPVWQQAAEGKDVDWQALFEGYDAVVDWPGCAFAPQLAELWPDALVLFSLRDFDSWWKSASNTIFPSSMQAEGEWRDMINALFGNTFTLALDDEREVRAAFDRHHEWIRAQIPADRILDWRAGDGFGPICERLGLPVPETPFPHTNTTEEFNARKGG